MCPRPAEAERGRWRRERERETDPKPASHVSGAKPAAPATSTPEAVRPAPPALARGLRPRPRGGALSGVDGHWRPLVASRQADELATLTSTEASYMPNVHSNGPGAHTNE